MNDDTLVSAWEQVSDRLHHISFPPLEDKRPESSDAFETSWKSEIERPVPSKAEIRYQPARSASTTTKSRPGILLECHISFQIPYAVVVEHRLD